MAMAKRQFPQYDKLNIPTIESQIQENWKQEDTFKKSVSSRPENKPYVFFEGPPSANGMPGIHHVISRTIKDIFCRYKTLQGFRVERKAGWDTHGLPVELQVEKVLGITKEDIGKKISVADYNQKCREDVLKFKSEWDRLTEMIGYWVDLDKPYVTYEKDYIETLWALLKRLYDKDLLYKGFTIQPFSPAAGTGLSSHELNQPGTYRNVKDTTVVAQFLVENPDLLTTEKWGNLYFLAWTTTPWTLPSNTALGVGKKIEYAIVQTFNPYTTEKQTVILAKERLSAYFNSENQTDTLPEAYEGGKNPLPYKVLKVIKGADITGLKYQQLLPYAQPEDGKAFEVIHGDFVTTEDGTGIVHLAPSFGADDQLVAKQNGIGSLTLVDREGKFVDSMGEFAGRYVKDYKNEANYQSVDIDIAVKLKQENKAFKVEKYEHSYPHCWRTDKPVLYYPMESWFIKTTAVKDRLVALNKTINWKPQHTGEGRFGNWLENLVDWNLSRSRYWGTPLPIWRTKDGESETCIGSVVELQKEIDRSVATGHMKNNPARENPDFDLHRPFIDEVILTSESGEKMYREPDLIDVWFDSGAMPYAQWHYPFENLDKVEENKAFPADFIAEGVDQTRGWFFTLHALGVMLFDSVAYKNVVANGLVLDKNGNKMSKRLGNTVDPFTTVEKHGADVVRWYMLSNSAPWDNLKFDINGLDETKRKFFGTLYNTYSFFALYCNLDGFDPKDSPIPPADRAEMDQWILSKLHSLTQTVQEAMDNYEPTIATRAIQEFTIDNLSNWYIRLNRRRFWKGEYGADKKAAYQTLHECLVTISQLMASFSPFYSDQLYRDLTGSAESVHLTTFPQVNKAIIDTDLEERMEIAQTMSSLLLGIRKKEKIKVRQPLAKVLVPITNPAIKEKIEKVKDIVLSEVNVKNLEYIEDDDQSIIVKQIQPNFKALGPQLGPNMKKVAPLIKNLGAERIAELESGKTVTISWDDATFELKPEDVEIHAKEVPGWQVASQGKVTVALDLTITKDLAEEGQARELVNRLQNLRKSRGLEVTDRVTIILQDDVEIRDSINSFNQYICGEILADGIALKAADQWPDQIEINALTLGVNLRKV